MGRGGAIPNQEESCVGAGEYGEVSRQRGEGLAEPRECWLGADGQLTVGLERPADRLLGGHRIGGRAAQRARFSNAIVGWAREA